jgi:P pilus assembly chaperone PapD
MYMKVGIPIFIRPARPENRMIVEDASMTGGTMKLKLKNSGNVHAIVTNIHIQGFDGANTASFDRNIGGWYILKGTEKIYTTRVPPEVCGSIKSYSIEIKTRDETLTKQLPALGTTCGEVAETAETR